MSSVIGRGGKNNSNRLFRGTSRNRPDGLKGRKEEALERQTAWDNLSPQQRVSELDRRLGAGVGAVSQRARLADLLAGRTKQAVIASPQQSQEEATSQAQVNSFAELQKSSALPEEFEILENASPKKMKAKDRRRNEKN